MKYKVMILTLLSFSLNACVTANKDNIDNATRSASYDVQAAYRNILVNAYSAKSILQNPEALGRESVETDITSPALDLTVSPNRTFQGKLALSKPYSSTTIVDGEVFKEREGLIFIDVDSFRYLGSTSSTYHTDTVNTKFYDLPNKAVIGDSGRLNEGYLEYKASSFSDELLTATCNDMWVLKAADNQNAKLCTNSKIHYTPNRVDTVQTCYTINRKGDILHHEGQSTIMRNSPDDSDLIFKSFQVN
ncbi:hypothetical protein [Psychrobacter sp. FDAARGOS_221]|uniref:hypothetical protein n=1 Tax=Psychrobacter sp. FDAARGOS_221 TaxID=1975705 RepID=UPI000BB5741B|nr:hypothetical protein [Psychrobacter sp. FDAARGOS_221]PNK60040.1 hypothetical protein A6J60_003545 [Psychrobacter sp. FDAARGOS_221]